MEKTVNLQIVLNDMLKLYVLLKDCVEQLNQLIRQKNPGLPGDPLQVVIRNGEKILLEFIKNKNSKYTVFFDSVVLKPYGASYREMIGEIFFIQSCIFEVCRDYDLFKEVPMHGKAGGPHQASFSFVLNGDKYEYILWTPPAAKVAG